MAHGFSLGRPARTAGPGLLRRESRALRAGSVHAARPAGRGRDPGGGVAHAPGWSPGCSPRCSAIGERRLAGAGRGGGAGRARRRARPGAGTRPARRRGGRPRPAARRRLRPAARRRPGRPRGVGERAALVVDRVEALDGYFGRWLPAATLAVLAPLLVIAAAAWADPQSGLLLAVAGAAGTPSPWRGPASARRRPAAGSSRRWSGSPAASSTACAACRRWCCSTGRRPRRRRWARRRRSCGSRTMKVLRVAFLSGTALELLSALALACIAWRHGALLGGGDPTAGAVLPAAGAGLLRAAARPSPPPITSASPPPAPPPPWRRCCWSPEPERPAAGGDAAAAWWSPSPRSG